MASLVKGLDRRHPEMELVVHEPEVCDVMLRTIKPGWCCVDAGANDGYFTGFMSHLVGEMGMVVAFEPDKVLYERLKRNTADLPNVELSTFPLWSVDCPMEFHRAQESGYSGFIKYDNINAESYMVSARALDSLLLSPQPNFIKVDCEGADEHVLRGAEKILRRGVECVTTEMNFYLNHKFSSSDRTLRDFMNGLGYDCFLLENEYKPLLLQPDDTLTLTGHGMFLVNAMFAKRKRVEELWQYDCRDELHIRMAVERHVSGPSVNIQQRRRSHG